MSKVNLLLLLVLFCSCSRGTKTPIELNADQISGIRDFLATKCAVENADFFNGLKDATLASFEDNGDTAVGKKYTLKETGKPDQELVILKINSDMLYAYISGEEGNKVYRYLASNNNEHADLLKSIACGSLNKFTQDNGNLSYTANSYSPNQTDAARTEYQSIYTVKSTLPIFFSIYNRSYKKVEYIDNEASKTYETKVTMESSGDVSLDDYKVKFENAKHCRFDSGASASWLSSIFQNDFEAATDLNPCANNVFDWEDDIL
jgi:hypothetical protein